MGDIELQIFSDRLKELRTELKLTQAQFVEDLGITSAALSAYEKNLKNPSISVAKRIAEKYHVSIDWLCGLTNKKQYNEEIRTYGDILRLFLKLYDANVNLKQSFETEIHDKFSNDPWATLEIYDDKVVNFFEEWEDVRGLYNGNTLKKHLYTLWLNDKIEEYDLIPLPNLDNPPQEETDT